MNEKEVYSEWYNMMIARKRYDCTAGKKKKVNDERADVRA